MGSEVRIQFELNEERFAELEVLKDELGLKTKKDLLNNALSLLKWTVKEIKSGRIIASMDEQNGKYKELSMPIFSAVQVEPKNNKKGKHTFASV